MGTALIRQVLSESQKIWLSHAKARSGQVALWCGRRRNYNCTSTQSGKESPGQP